MLFNKVIDHDEIERIFKVSSKIIAIYYILLSLFLSFQIAITKVLSIKVIPVIVSLIFIFSIIIFICSFKKEPSMIYLFSLSSLIFLANIFPQTSSILFYILPIIFSLYTFNQKKIITTVIFSGIMMIGSFIFRSLLISKLSDRSVISSMTSLSSIIIILFEILIMIYASIPIFIYFISADQYQYKMMQEKKSATSDILQFCSVALVYHNRYLDAHISGVRDLTKLILDSFIAEGKDVNKYYYEQILFSVQFHDIGKLYIPPSILDKPGRLTPEERVLIEEHPERGKALVNMLPKNVMDENTFTICQNIIYQHHERLSGCGYPQGLKGDEIRFEAQIVAVADVLDALLAWRPYKRPMTWENAMKVFEENKDDYSEECLKIVVKNKEKILAISDKNNKKLQKLLSLDQEEITRK